MKDRKDLGSRRVVKLFEYCKRAEGCNSALLKKGFLSRLFGYFIPIMCSYCFE